eukprot:15353445-Alexandrium_andersonii.AAC.1
MPNQYPSGTTLDRAFAPRRYRPSTQTNSEIPHVLSLSVWPAGKMLLHGRTWTVTHQARGGQRATLHLGSDN